MQEPNRHILLFDGLCNLCNGYVNFVLKHDTEKIFRFASQQSQSGQDLLSRFGLPSSQMSTVVLIEGESVYFKSTAALRVLRKLEWPYRGLYLGILIPASTRDWAYTLIAKNRYRIFGKREACMVPTPDLAVRFLP
jgi:predicted DCC family thiol-disulfide oxidoreductase YuxK